MKTLLFLQCTVHTQHETGAAVNRNRLSQADRKLLQLVSHSGQLKLKQPITRQQLSAFRQVLKFKPTVEEVVFKKKIQINIIYGGNVVCMF